MYGFDTLDFCIFVFIALAIIVGFFRGPLKEFLSLVAWVVSFVVALVGYGLVYGNIEGFHKIQATPEIKQFWAFLALFLVVFTLLSVVRFVITVFVSSIGMNVSNRFLGMVFGFLKGAFIIYIFLMIAQNFVDDSEVFKRSVVLGEAKPYFVFEPGTSNDKNNKENHKGGNYVNDNIAKIKNLADENRFAKIIRINEEK